MENERLKQRLQNAKAKDEALRSQAHQAASSSLSGSTSHGISDIAAPQFTWLVDSAGRNCSLSRQQFYSVLPDAGNFASSSGTSAIIPAPNSASPTSREPPGVSGDRGPLRKKVTRTVPARPTPRESYANCVSVIQSRKSAVQESYHCMRCGITDSPEWRKVRPSPPRCPPAVRLLFADTPGCRRDRTGPKRCVMPVDLVTRRISARTVTDHTNGA